MKNSKQLRQHSHALLQRTGLPAEFFRHVIRSCGVGIASQCCVEGFADDAIAEYLEWLGFDVAENADVPLMPFDASSPGNPSMAEPPVANCDLVIAPMSSASPRMLMDVDLLRRTADLLASLKPGGHLVFVSTRKAEFAFATDALAGYRRQLAEFPGILHAEEHRPGTLRSLKSRWNGEGPALEFCTATLQTPDHAVSRNEWLAIAERVAASNPAVYCDSSAIERPSSELRDAA